MRESGGWLAVSPRQLYEASRLLDAQGPGLLRSNGRGRLAVLLDADGIGGIPWARPFGRSRSRLPFIGLGP